MRTNVLLPEAPLVCKLFIALGTVCITILRCVNVIYVSEKINKVKEILNEDHIGSGKINSTGRILLCAWQTLGLPFVMKLIG